MPRPDTEGRYEILRLQLTSKNVAPDVDLLQLARDLPGLVGADLANIVNEAQLNCKYRKWPLHGQHRRLAYCVERVHSRAQLATPLRHDMCGSCRFKCFLVMLPCCLSPTCQLVGS